MTSDLFLVFRKQQLSFIYWYYVLQIYWIFLSPLWFLWLILYGILHVWSVISKRDSIISSIPIWMPFISFYCPIPLAKISSTTLNKSGRSDHSSSVPNLRGQALLSKVFFVGSFFFSFSTWNVSPYSNLTHKVSAEKFT